MAKKSVGKKSIGRKHAEEKKSIGRKHAEEMARGNYLLGRKETKNQAVQRVSRGKMRLDPDGFITNRPVLERVKEKNNTKYSARGWRGVSVGKQDSKALDRVTKAEQDRKRIRKKKKLTN